LNSNILTPLGALHAHYHGVTSPRCVAALVTVLHAGETPYRGNVNLFAGFWFFWLRRRRYRRRQCCEAGGILRQEDADRWLNIEFYLDKIALPPLC